MTTDISRVRALVPAERGLAVVSTQRRDGTIQASVVNAGVVPHPLTHDDAVAFVAMGGSVKLRNLRADPRITVVLRAAFRWVSVEGEATLIGPDDSADGFDAERVPRLLRDVFLATGATHDDWATFDRVMAEERRCAVLVTPRRVYGVD
jgi:PPOX class probable F420-dependent enzyme